MSASLLSPLLHDALIPLEIRKGDETIPMIQNVKIYPVFGVGDESGVMIIIEDLTEQILYEKEIARLNRILRGIRNVNQLITQADSVDQILAGAYK